MIGRRRGMARVARRKGMASARGGRRRGMSREVRRRVMARGVWRGRTSSQRSREPLMARYCQS